MASTAPQKPRSVKPARRIHRDENKPKGARTDAATISFGEALKLAASATKGTTARPAMAPLWTISQILTDIDFSGTLVGNLGQAAVRIKVRS